MVGTETLPDGRERRHWLSESDWCSLEIRCLMLIDECLPTPMMVDEERRLQCSRFGEISVLGCGVDQVPVGITSTRLRQSENVIRALLAFRQEDNAEIRSWAVLAVALPPCDE